MGDVNQETYNVDINIPVRVDKFLAEHMDGISRSYIQRLIKEGCVSVNGCEVKVNHKVASPDQIKVRMQQPKEPDILPENIPLDILYEDRDILVVNKPKGMVVHPSAGHYSQTLVNGLMYHCKDNLSGINGVLRPGIVHRIDMDTTGSLIVCKNDKAHRSLAEQLKNHTVKREYHAIVHGNLKEDKRIDAPIGRHPIHRKKMSIDVKNGKQAVTHYEIIGQLRNYTYIKCYLETGRTHQIRVHMASIKHPLLGDMVYGPAKCPFPLTGQTLHAKTVGFIHPSTNEYMEINAPLPEYFQKLLQQLG